VNARARAARLSLAIALVVAGCVSPRSAADVQLQLDNATDTPVGLYVDGTWIGTYPAGATTTLPLRQQGDPPYRIEARSPSGTVLAATEVNVPSLESLEAGTGMPVGESVGLPCGVVTLLVGELAPDQALSPAMSVPPGPCP